MMDDFRAAALSIEAAEAKSVSKMLERQREASIDEYNSAVRRVNREGSS